MNTRVYLLIFFLASLVFTSCEVEFSPNDNWREIPVVYCLLDQDDDTSYVRVQRCFMGEGDNNAYTTIKDSIYYPQGEISVYLEEWNATRNSSGRSFSVGSSPRRIYTFDYMERTGNENGEFYSSEHPLFCCATGGQLDTNCLYRLKVVKNSTGDTIASGETRLISGEMHLSSPNNATLFQFSYNGASRSCEFKWSTMQEARQYQPLVRFFYRDFIVTQTGNVWDTVITPHYIDIPGNVVKSNMRSTTLTTNFEQSYFLNYIKDALQGDTCNKNIVDTVEIFIFCCNEPLAAYIYANNPMGAFSQDPFTYTNIDGGLGVFAARRRHISFRVQTPGSILSNYVKSLKDLGVGF